MRTIQYFAGWRVFTFLTLLAWLPAQSKPRLPSAAHVTFSAFIGQSSAIPRQDSAHWRRLPGAGRTWPTQITISGIGEVWIGDTLWKTEECKEQIAKNPDAVDARIALGFYQLKTGKFGDAIENFKKAIPSSPTGYSADLRNQGLAWGYYELGRRARTEMSGGFLVYLSFEQEVYETALESGSNSAKKNALHNSACSYIDLGLWIGVKHGELSAEVALPSSAKISGIEAFEKADELLSAVLSNYRNPPETAFDRRIFVLTELGRPEQARETAKKKQRYLELRETDQMMSEITSMLYKGISRQQRLPKWFVADYKEGLEYLLEGDSNRWSNNREETFGRLAARAVASASGSRVSDLNDSLKTILENKAIRIIDSVFSDSLSSLTNKISRKYLEDLLENGDLDNALTAVASLEAHGSHIDSAWAAIKTKEIQAAIQARAEAVRRRLAQQREQKLQEQEGAEDAGDNAMEEPNSELPPDVDIVSGAFRRIRDLVWAKEFSTALAGINAYRTRFDDLYGNRWIEELLKAMGNTYDGSADDKRAADFRAELKSMLRDG